MLIVCRKGAKSEVLRKTGRALCFSTAEYACSVWLRSAHARKVDISLNKTCGLVTGCKKAPSLTKQLAFTDPTHEGSRMN